MNKQQKSNMKACKGRVIWDCTDGTNCDMGFILPHEILSIIMCHIVSWKDDFQMTPNEYERFVEDIKNIKDKQNDTI